MRNMSFMLTEWQIRTRCKWVTRRNGWRFLKVGDLLRAVNKSQGLKKGEHPVRLAEIRVISTRWERLDAVTERDVIAEGFSGQTPRWFINFYCDHNGGDGSQLINRIEFEYVGLD
jgi:hypothetical protein